MERTISAKGGGRRRRGCEVEIRESGVKEKTELKTRVPFIYDGAKHTHTHPTRFTMRVVGPFPIKRPSL